MLKETDNVMFSPPRRRLLFDFGSRSHLRPGSPVRQCCPRQDQPHGREARQGFRRQERLVFRRPQFLLQIALVPRLVYSGHDVQVRPEELVFGNTEMHYNLLLSIKLNKTNQHVLFVLSLYQTYKTCNN